MYLSPIKLKKGRRQKRSIYRNKNNYVPRNKNNSFQMNGVNFMKA